MKVARLDQAQSCVPTTPPAHGWLEFAAYLARKHAIHGDLLGQGLLGQAGKSAGATAAPARERRLRDLWQLTDLGAGDFADEVAHFYNLPRLNLPELLAGTCDLQRFSSRFLRENALFPCRTGNGGHTLVVADPSDAVAIRAVEIVMGGPVSLAVASFEDIATVLSERLSEEKSLAPEASPAAPGRAEDDIENLRDLASGAPVVRAVNDLLERALELRATDIHIEPFRSGVSLRLRIDGLLRSIPAPADLIPQALISRVKILAGLNIAERRLPQDGAAHLRIARSEVDVRVATMPTQYGESAVIRLLPKDRGILELKKVGLSEVDERKVERLLKLPHGIIIVTGPTGSGKTTTLATMLSILNDTTRKILTIEDPVEYEIPGINQSQVKPEIGLTFATALRGFVRQDPDVIMVGEIRDAETANIAIHAALTGHLVLTTLHTETAVAAVPRLLDLGVEGFLLQSTLRSVMAQRLVRILCDRCKIKQPLTEAMLAADPRYATLGLKVGEIVHEPGHCERCSGSGYRGRTGVLEVLEITDDIRQVMSSHRDASTLQGVAQRAGMTTMFEHGVAKCRAGVTSAAEVLRVTTLG